MEFPVGHQGRLCREGNIEAGQFWKTRWQDESGKSFQVERTMWPKV